MPVKTKKELKNAFKKGSIPTQEDFENLIDSFIHIEESSWPGSEDGAKFLPCGTSKKFASFFYNIVNKSAVWIIEPYPKNNDIFGLNLVDINGKSKLLVSNNGDIGIGTLSPQTKLDVDGNIQSCGRRGTYKNGKVLADGEWHKIIEHLSDCHIFEIVAKVNKPGYGMHSVIHSIATNAFNGSRKDINTTCSYYGSFRNKIKLRWTGDTFDYNLEIKTAKNYEGEYYIEYYITNLLF